MKLTVYFEGQFWVGVLEETAAEQVRACRYIFGAEPKDAEVLEFVQKQALPLLDRVSQSVACKPVTERTINPKRMARLAAKEVKQRGISTYAQEALRLELEKRKLERKQISRQQREAEKERKWALKVAKAKQKHRGK